MLKDYFPNGVVPRKQQIEAIDKIEEIWHKKKYAIGILPTGSGKSHIAMTVGNSSCEIPDKIKGYIKDYSIYRKMDSNSPMVADFENSPSYGSYILTISKSLQDQYQNLFPDGMSIKGKSNYRCYIDDDFTAEFAPCSLSAKQKQRCFSENCCPYYIARNEGLCDKSPFLNYSVFLNLPDFLQKRQYLILDEAAELEEEFVSKYKIDLKYKFLKSEGIHCKPFRSKKMEDAKIWVSEIYQEIESIVVDLVSEMRKQSSHNGGVSVDLKKSQKITRLTNLMNIMGVAINNWENCQYLIESSTDEGIVFCPYDIRPFTLQVFDKADKVLMMSATISNVEEFAKSVGLSKDDYGVFEVESAFDPKKSPIYCSKKYSLSYKTMDMLLPKIVESALEICMNNHPNEKGLIHTYTNKITQEFIRQVSGDKRFLFREDKVTNEHILEEHKNSDVPTILVSPSLDTGVSLDGELGRFQLIMKAPYLSLGSGRIKKMFDEFPKRYSAKMLDTIIQMCGRCTRSVDDYSVTYILDGTAVNAIQRESNHLPKSFLGRFV